MSGYSKLLAKAVLVTVSLAAYSCFAAGDFVSAASADGAREQSWNREQKTIAKQDAVANIQRKAEARAEQRQARLASMSWYGMSNGRPTGGPTPFTSRYGPTWESPGGRPFSWYPSYTYTSPTVVWYRR